MKLPVLPGLALAAVLLLGACSTVESRIREKPEVFAALPPAAQQKIREGVIEVGYPADLVYIVLGRPDDEIHTITKHGEDETWIYNSYHEEYAGTVRIGYRRYIAVDPRTGQRVVFVEPVYTDVYRPYTEERIRVVFVAGKVSAIEQVKR